MDRDFIENVSMAELGCQFNKGAASAQKAIRLKQKPEDIHSWHLTIGSFLHPFLFFNRFSFSVAPIRAFTLSVS